jgi:hypothetical protein
MYKLKQKEGYRKVYDVRLCKGEIFKTTNELKELNNRLSEYTDEFIEASENSEELIEKKKKLEKRRDNKIVNIKNLKQELVTYDDLLQKHESGELDEEYTDKYENKEEEKSIRREKRFEKRTKTNTENKQVSQQFYNNSRQASSRTRYMNKQYDYHYRYFLRNSSKIPEFIRRNLKNMSNNKGYIWRGIWFYGEKPIPKIRRKDGTYTEENTLKMHEIVGKDTFIRFKDENGQWTITKKDKNFRNNDNNQWGKKDKNFRNNNDKDDKDDKDDNGSWTKKGKSFRKNNFRNNNFRNNNSKINN